MSTENIIQEVLSDNISSAKKQTEELLYSKLSDAINAMKEDVVGSTYEDAIGIATLAEKRKAKKNGDDENGDKEQKYAKKTDKEDDGEGLDPVDAEDSDVDNDGDSDSSDDYLKNRRKTVKKAVKKDDEEEDEVDEGYNVTATHDDHIKASAAIGSGTSRRGPLAGGQSVGNKKYNLRFNSKKTGKKFMQKHGFTEETMYGMDKEKYMKLTDTEKDKIKIKYHREKEEAQKEKGHS